MTIEVYVVDGIAMSEKVLKQKIEPQDDKSYKEVVAAHFKTGKWHTINVKGTWTFGDRSEVNRRLRVVDPTTGNITTEDWRYFPVLCACAVESWDLEDGKGDRVPVTEEGYARLPVTVADVVGQMVDQAVYPNIDMDTFFTR